MPTLALSPLARLKELRACLLGMPASPDVRLRLLLLRYFPKVYPRLMEYRVALGEVNSMLLRMK